MNLASEVSSLQSELESLRSENKILRESKLIADFELDQLRRRLSQVEAQRDVHLSSKVRLKTLLDQAGQQLVSGIQRYNDEARIEQTEMLGTEEPRMIEAAE
jgi:regulator of replication initiation timing